VHELSLAQAIIDRVSEDARQRGIRQVRRVTLRVGEWSAVLPDSLAFGFELLAQAAGEPVAGAQLVIHMVPAEGECPACGHRFPTGETGLRCPACGGSARLVAGGELDIESYEGE